MSIAPDESDLDLDLDFERSRAAVAVACLRWLRCTGPNVEPRPGHATPPGVADLLGNPPPIVGPVHSPELFDEPHPLWDRWLDG